MLSGFFFFFGWEACGIPVPRPGIEPASLSWKVKSQGKASFHTFVKKIHVYVFLTWDWKSRDQLWEQPQTLLSAKSRHIYLLRWSRDFWMRDGSQPLWWWQLFILPSGWSRLSYWFKDILIWTVLQTLYASNFDLTSGLCVLAAAFTWLSLILFSSVCLRIVQHILKNHNLNLIDSPFSSVARIS